MRGYQKKIVCLKKTDSPIIDEAYFVLSGGVDFGCQRENLIKEANRIIEENTGEKKKRDGRFLFFCLGVLSSSAVALVLFILTRLWGFI